ncbi:hypothetical protein [Mannheimia haemolytica]|uniref:hypothetical protein n=1 Tax=Mannheimia haemolytica TaxID=75985 RepID=UPI00201BC1C4|nr:hypothetical protein [Mannheimia haemolytica]UQX68812.1 hypothetical protein M3705_07290 [Mannheimia haemolytica]
MSLKSKLSAFATAYKSVLENANNDEWNNAGKDVCIKDTLVVIGKGSTYLAKEAVEFSGILAKTTAKILMTPTYSKEHYNGYQYGPEGYGYYSNGMKIHD